MTGSSSSAHPQANLPIHGPEQMRALGWGSKAQGGQQQVRKQQQAEEAHEDQQHEQHDIGSEGR